MNHQFIADGKRCLQISNLFVRRRYESRRQIQKETAATGRIQLEKFAKECRHSPKGLIRPYLELGLFKQGGIPYGHKVNFDFFVRHGVTTGSTIELRFVPFVCVKLCRRAVPADRRVTDGQISGASRGFSTGRLVRRFQSEDCGLLLCVAMTPSPPLPSLRQAVKRLEQASILAGAPQSPKMDASSYLDALAFLLHLQKDHEALRQRL